MYAVLGGGGNAPSFVPSLDEKKWKGLGERFLFLSFVPSLKDYFCFEGFLFETFTQILVVLLLSVID
jgi:hypothetical protein